MVSESGVPVAPLEQGPFFSVSSMRPSCAGSWYDSLVEAIVEATAELACDPPYDPPVVDRRADPSPAAFWCMASTASRITPQ